MQYPEFVTVRSVGERRSMPSLFAHASGGHKLSRLHAVLSPVRAHQLLSMLPTLLMVTSSALHAVLSSVREHTRFGQECRC